jgi:DNA polymerase I-like protein with 3'-5' exonuclease and polymerase domains
MRNIYKLGTIPELVKQLQTDKSLFLDTETSKLGSQIRLVQLYQEDWPFALIFDTVNTNLTVLWSVISSYHLVGHNLTYDFGCFRKDIPETFKIPEQWDDTFYLSRLACPEWQKYSLDECLTKVIGEDPYETEGLVKKQLQMSFERIMVKGNYIEGPEGLKDITQTQYLYAATDVYDLPKLWNRVKHMTNNFVYILDKLTIEHIQTDELGLAVDLDRLTDLQNKDYLKIAEIDKQLPNGFNVNSYIQVRKLLGTVLSSDEEALTIIQARPDGLTGLEQRITMTNGSWAAALKKGIDDGTLSVVTKEFGNSKPVLKSIDLPRSNRVLVYYIENSYLHGPEVMNYAKLINEKRKALKRLNFADRALKAIKVDLQGISRIRGTFSPHAINGRIQVDNENLSQYPRTMKSMWGHPKGNGRKLLYSDFAQVELRIICAALPEMNMYKSLKEGIDLHTFVGNNLNLSKEDLSQLPDGISPRFIAKQCNFLLLYGGGISNFQKTVCKLGGVWFETDIATKIANNWKDIFSDIKLWHEKNGKSQTKMDSTVSGRIYKADTVTDLNNIRVSGTGSEVFKLWLHYVDKYIISKYPEVFITNRVHDSIILDIPDDEVLYTKLSRKVALCAQAAWFEIIKNAPLIDVPMPVDVAVGSNWDDIEHGTSDYNFELDGMYMYGKDLEEEINND